MNFGSHWFFYLKHIRSSIFYSENNFFSTPSLFTVSIKIAPYLIDPSDWWKMGGSASSKLASGNEAQIKEKSMTNVGLVNLADTGESTGLTFNVVEAATCGIAFLIALFLIRWCCIKRRQQRMLQMQQGIG